jgi:hypothetical protein
MSQTPIENAGLFMHECSSTRQYATIKNELNLQNDATMYKLPRIGENRIRKNTLACNGTCLKYEEKNKRK